jgi:hypothetical protein
MSKLSAIVVRTPDCTQAITDVARLEAETPSCGETLKKYGLTLACHDGSDGGIHADAH